MSTHMHQSASYLTIAISTRYGSQALIKTVESIYRSKGLAPFRFIIVADTKPITRPMRKKFEALGVVVIENKTPGSLASKFSQILSMCTSKYLVFTQDDITFNSNTIELLIGALEQDQAASMSVSRVVPVAAKTFFESIVNIGPEIVFRIGTAWHKADNYLLVNGRCICLRTSIAKRFVIPKGVVNLDAYFYFENKRVGGKFVYVPSSHVFNRSPLVMDEHLNQSSRYQRSHEELSHYFPSLASEYRIPKIVALRASFMTLFFHPVRTFLYLCVFAYTRLRKKAKEIVINPLWEPDLTTKRAH